MELKFLENRKQKREQQEREVEVQKKEIIEIIKSVTNKPIPGPEGPEQFTMKDPDQ